MKSNNSPPQKNVVYSPMRNQTNDISKNFTIKKNCQSPTQSESTNYSNNPNSNINNNSYVQIIKMKKENMEKVMVIKYMK